MGREITRTMTFGELLGEYPSVAAILSERGLHCIGCHIAVSESVEDGARAHGLSEAEIESMMDEIRAAAK